MYTYICIYIYTHMYLYIYTCAYIYTYTFTHIYTHHYYLSMPHHQNCTSDNSTQEWVGNWQTHLRIIASFTEGTEHALVVHLTPLNANTKGVALTPSS